MAEYKFHPFLEIFDPETGTAPGGISLLADSIKDNGQMVPIIRRKIDGIILDGRRRLKACEAACVGPWIVDVEADEELSMEIVFCSNLERRQLTDDEQIEAIKRYNNRPRFRRD